MVISVYYRCGATNAHLVDLLKDFIFLR